MKIAPLPQAAANSTKDMILALRGPAIERPIELPEPPATLSPETQAQLRTLGAATAVSERRRRWLIFRQFARFFAEQRAMPEPVPIDWSAMQARPLHRKAS